MKKLILLFCLVASSLYAQHGVEAVFSAMSLTTITGDSICLDSGSLIFSNTTNQLFGQTDYDVITMGFDSPSLMNPDSLFPTCNKYPWAVTVDSIRRISDVDDQDISVCYKNMDGSGPTLIDALTCSTDETNQYSVLETTITQATIPANAQIGIPKPSAAGENVRVFIYIHFTKAAR